MAKPIARLLDQIRDGNEEEGDRARGSIQRLHREDVDCVPTLLSYRIAVILRKGYGWRAASR